jgi:cell division protein FtsI/penicillin-binding protein 2
MQQQDSPAEIQRRLPLLVAFVIFCTMVLFVRLWYLQAVKGAFYLEQAESNRIRPVKLRPPRGIMYDRKAAPSSRTRSPSIFRSCRDAPNLASIQSLATTSR